MLTASKENKQSRYRDAFGRKIERIIGKNEITILCEDLGDKDLYIHHYKENSKNYYTQWILTNGIEEEKSQLIKSTNSLAVKNIKRDGSLKTEANNLVDIDVEEHLQKAGTIVSNNLKQIFPPKSNLDRSLKDTQLIQLATEIERKEKKYFKKT